MLYSLILAFASQVMAQNFTYTYIPGFFVQDNPQADPNSIGPVRKTRFLGRFGAYN